MSRTSKVLAASELSVDDDGPVYVSSGNQSVHTEIETASITNTGDGPVRVVLKLTRVDDGEHGTATILDRDIDTRVTVSLRDLLAGACLGPGEMLTGRASARGVEIAVTGSFGSHWQHG